MRSPEAGAISKIQGILLINRCSHEGNGGGGFPNCSNENMEASPGAVKESSPGMERPKPERTATLVVPHSIFNVSAPNSAGIVGDKGIEATSVQMQCEMTTPCHMCIKKMKIVLHITPICKKTMIVWCLMERP